MQSGLQFYNILLELKITTFWMPYPDDFEFRYVLAAKNWHTVDHMAQV